MSSEGKSASSMEEWGDNFWTKNFAPWHRGHVHPLLARIMPELVGDRKGLKIFVPLCGKTVDMKWFADEGHQVVGVEGIETAAKQFMEEQQLHCDVQQKTLGGETISVYVANEQPIKIYCCDILVFNREVEGQFDLIWDRASFEAMELCDKTRYGEILGGLLKRTGGQYLLSVADYDPALNPGEAPYPVADEDVTKHFAWSTVRKLDTVDSNPGTRPTWLSGEDDFFGEKYFLLSPRTDE